MVLNKERNARISVAWGFIFKIVSLVCPFIIRTLLIKIMGSEYSGLGSLFTTILQVLSLAELGFGTAMVYSMYKPVAQDDKSKLSAILKYYRKIYYIISIIILVAGAAVLPFLKFLVKDDVPSSVNLYILYGIYVLNTFISYFGLAYRASLLSTYQKEDINSIANLIVNVLLYAAQIIVLIIHPNYYLFIIFLPITTLLLNVIKYFYVKKKYKDITPTGELDEDVRKEIKTNMAALLCHKVGGVVVNSADNIVISAFLGLVVLSNYNNYYYLLSAISAFIIIIFTSLCAGVGNSLIVKTKEENERFFNRVFLINCVVVSFCTICFFNLYQLFVEFWVGKELMFDFFTVILFCIYFYLHMIRRTIIMYRDAFGAWKDRNKIQPIVSCIFNLIVNIILVNFIGIYGILISTILSMVLIDIPWETITFFKNISKYSPKKYIIFGVSFIISTTISCLICYFIPFNVENLIVNMIINLGVSIAIFGLIQGPMYIVFKRMNRKVYNIDMYKS
jgi:O-antigen/teichoic acid export membrane protein